MQILKLISSSSSTLDCKNWSFGKLKNKARLKKSHLKMQIALFMKANGTQLEQITRLIEAGVIRPVVDKVFPFEATNEAMAYVETGRAKGKVVIKMK